MTEKRRLVFLVRFILVCFLSLAFLRVGSCQTDEEIQDYIISGCRKLVNNELDKAIEQFDKAINYIKSEKPKPEYSLAYYNRGRAYERAGELDKAYADYQQAIKLDPRYLLAYYGIAYVHQKKREYDNAISWYNTIISLDPKQPHAYNNLGLCFMEKKDFVQAMNNYNRAIELDYNLLNAHYNRGVLKVHNRDYFEATFDFQKELSIYPNTLRSKYYDKAILAFLNKQYEESWQAVSKLQNMGEPVRENFIEDLKKASGKQN